MTRALAILLALLLGACASVPQRTVTVTTAAGETYTAPIKTVADPRTYADGSRMDWVDIAFFKSQDALPKPDPTEPLWACLAGDLVSTGVGLSLGMREVNPLGWWAMPINVWTIKMAQKAEREGDPSMARFYCTAHRFVTVLNWIGIGVVAL